jgi:hypothetical protein
MSIPSRATTDPLRADDLLLLTINVAGLAIAAMAAVGHWGPWSAYLSVVVTSVLYLAHVQWRQHDVLKNLLVFGTAAGLTELAADRWLVSVTHSLVYAPWGPFLIDSPAYMPMSWAGILLSMGALGVYLHGRFGMIAAVAVTFVVTGTYVPFFEALAHFAGWWTYQNVPSLSVVPWYIIVGEALIGASLTPLVMVTMARAGSSKTSGFLSAALVGGIAGLWIWVTYAIAYWMTVPS